MGWIDKLSRYIGEKTVKNKLNMEEEKPLPDIKQELDLLEELRLELVRKDEELSRTRLEWDRTFDSIIDNIVLIDRERNISKANNAFYNCMEREVGHIDFIGMNWDEFKKIARHPQNDITVDRCFETGVHQESTMEIRGKTINVSVNPVYVKTNIGNEMIGVVRVTRDITDIERIKKALERRSAIYHSISEMSRVLVNHQDWSKAVNLILGDLGRSIGASRVYIFKNEVREDRLCSILQHVYHNENQRNCDSNSVTDCINYDLVPDWQSKMEHGLSVEGDLVECNICVNKHHCVCVDNVLVCAVPIFVDKKWWGFIGFDYYNGNRKWKDDDEILLRIAADILGGVIYHRGRYFDAINGLEECEEVVDGLYDTSKW